MSTPTELMNTQGFLPEPRGLNKQNQSRFANDGNLYVQFHIEPVMQELKSKQADRMVFEDKLFVRIMVPGDKHSIIDRQATSQDRQRFKKYLEAFQSGRDQEAIGTPLSVMPWLTPSMVAEYKYFNIHTIEQLANVADSAGQKFILFHEHKRKAEQFMQGVVPENVQKELDSRDEQIAELERKLSILLAAEETAEA